MLFRSTDARRAARTDGQGDLVLLDEQDRTRWDRAMIEEGEGLLVDALRMGRPGPYQLWAAIAACHSTAASADDTDWRQISVLYGELLTYDPSPVTEANRAIAVAMAEGPAAGLTILDVVLGHPQLATWPRIRPRRPVGPDGPRRGGGAGVPHRAGTGAARGRAALHPAPPGRGP